MRQTKLIKIQSEIIKTLDLFIIGPNTISIEVFTNDEYKLTMQIGTHYREIIRDIIKEIVTKCDEILLIQIKRRYGNL